MRQFNLATLVTAPTYIKAIDGWIGDKVLFNENEEIYKNAHKQLLVKDGYMAYEGTIEVEKKGVISSLDLEALIMQEN